MTTKDDLIRKILAAQGMQPVRSPVEGREEVEEEEQEDRRIAHPAVVPGEKEIICDYPLPGEEVSEVQRVQRGPFNFILYSFGEIRVSREGHFLTDEELQQRPELLQEAREALGLMPRPAEAFQPVRQGVIDGGMRPQTQFRATSPRRREAPGKRHGKRSLAEEAKETLAAYVEEIPLRPGLSKIEDPRFQQELARERQEHPTLPEAAVEQIVEDHMKKLRPADRILAGEAEIERYICPMCLEFIPVRDSVPNVTCPLCGTTSAVADIQRAP